MPGVPQHPSLVYASCRCSLPLGTANSATTTNEAVYLTSWLDRNPLAVCRVAGLQRSNFFQRFEPPKQLFNLDPPSNSRAMWLHPYGSFHSLCQKNIIVLLSFFWWANISNFFVDIPPWGGRLVWVIIHQSYCNTNTGSVDSVSG